MDPEEMEDVQEAVEQPQQVQPTSSEGLDETLAEDEEVTMGHDDEEQSDTEPIIDSGNSKRSDEDVPEISSSNPGSGSQALSERRATGESAEMEQQTPDKEDDDEDDESPLEPTHLGHAIDSLMMHWCQLLTNVSVKPPVPPPSTLDHVKEVAEVCSKHFRDAAVDVTNEFTRIGVQWELEQAAEQFGVEESNLDEAIARQEKLLKLATDAIQKRSESYERHYPEAGKHYTT